MTALPPSPLVELPPLPDDGSGLARRWFTSGEMDLIAWLDDRGLLQAFQLCWGKPEAERSLTWREGRGFHQQVVDPGYADGLGHKGSPLLTTDDPGLLPAGLRARLAAAAAAVPAGLLAAVDRHLARFPDPT
jgi:hypothetical protein